MSSVGENLKRQREVRGMTLEQVAEATGVSVVYLGAMERGEFDALPGRAFGKLYIRAYAEVLEFDPRPLIEEYDREHRPERAESPEPLRAAPAGSRPVAEAIARWKAGRTETDDRQEIAAAQEDAVQPVPEHFMEAEVEPPPEPETPREVEPPVELVEILVEPVPSAEPPRLDATTAIARRPRWRAALGFAGVVMIAGAIYFASRKNDAPETVTAPPVVPSESRSVPVAPEVAEPAPQEPPAKAPAAAPPVETPPPPGSITVPEFGLGRRIVDRRLEGESDRFEEGDVVVFQTRVLGGKHGQRLRHVWIFEGRAQQSIELRVGGADWRTHTSKTLYHSGTWRVEARDDGGRVLATATFTCVPRGR